MPGKSSRLGLFRHLQMIFEQHLAPHFRWGQVEILPGEPVLATKNYTPRRGEVRDIVTVRFGKGLELEVQSSEEAKPLGRVVLRKVDASGKADLVDGPLDGAVFARIGAKVNEMVQQRG